jgi:hypothetical protein
MHFPTTRIHLKCQWWLSHNNIPATLKGSTTGTNVNYGSISIFNTFTHKSVKYTEGGWTTHVFEFWTIFSFPDTNLSSLGIKNVMFIKYPLYFILKVTQFQVWLHLFTKIWCNMVTMNFSRLSSSLKFKITKIKICIIQASINTRSHLKK